MTLVEDKRSGGFVFTWSIHNFSYCVQKEKEFLDSPKFVAELIGNETCNLRLYPRGGEVPGFIGYYLRASISPASIFNFVLSIRDSNGLFKEIGEQQMNSTGQGYQNFLSLHELKEPDAQYLDNDTLILRCRMWREDADLSTSVKCSAHTKIKISKLDYMWTLNDVDSDHIIKYELNRTTVIPRVSTEIPGFTLKLLIAGTFNDDTIYFAIELLKQYSNVLLTCMIHLLDADGRVSHSVRGESLFGKSNATQTWTFPLISTRTLLSNKNKYLPNAGLSLHCEFYVSTSATNNEVEKLQCRKHEEIQLKTVTHNVVSDSAEPWKEIMKRFYIEGKFSDLTVRTPNGREFPVHKAILCAQSEVFSAMFESDLKENQTSVVEIEDLEDDTISKMLLFLYADTLEDIDFSMTSKLYYAADKYRITALCRKCSSLLTYFLDTSNVCDVLILADTHQDQELKSTARDFIFAHALEIMNSEAWKKLMEDNSSLTSETMHLMICKNFRGYLNHK